MACFELREDPYVTWTRFQLKYECDKHHRRLRIFIHRRFLTLSMNNRKRGSLMKTHYRVVIVGAGTGE